MISHKQKGLMAALQPALATVLLLVVVACTRPALTQGSGDQWLQYLTRPPFWRQQYTACGLSTIRNGVRPNLCANNVDFCLPDPYQPTFEVCTPCWKACLECTRYDTPLRNSSGITSNHCSSCGCATTAGCASSRTCRPGSYCDKYYGRCISCYECLADGDVREGSCRAVCGHAPRPQLPELFGLPFDALAAEDSDWVIDATIEVATWFKSSLGRIPAVGWLDLGQLLADRDMAFLPPGQLRYAVAQLTRANSTYSGYISPKPSPPPPSPRPSPSPPPPRPSPPSPNTTTFPPPRPRAPRARHLASYDPDPTFTIHDPHSFTTTTSSSSRHLTQTFDPDPSINPSVAPIYPEDFVRVFVMRQLEPYDAFCPSDAAIFATGRSYPGCTCMSIPPEYQQDTNVVTGSTKQWVDYLTSVAGSNASNANAVCPEGFRCSAMNYQHLRHLFTRSQVHITMGICVPCLVGEYCPEGTVEKSQQLVEVCTRRSALSESAGSSSNNSSGGGQDASDCVNTRLCPAGSYCPEPSVRQNCTNGNFCTEGSTEPVTCDFDVIIATLPFSMVQPEPEYVLTSVTAGGSPLSGNYCPANSPDPFDSCPRGYYCPEPGVKIVCPKGYFCPSQSVTPQRCGFLLECNKEGIGKPQVAWWGFLAFILLMLCLPVLGLVYKLYESRVMRRTARDDKLLEAMDAMGFGGDAADEGTDGPGGQDDHGAGLYGNEDERPRGWWARFKMWFRRWVLCRGSGGGRGSGRSTRRSKSLDEEDQRSQTVGPLPPGFSDIDTYLTIQFENLSLRIKSGRRILHDVSGDFPHSHVHAIMGPSGSGKSSFITALIGKSNGGTISGNVVVWKSTRRDELAAGGQAQVNVQESLGTACTYDDVRYLTGFVPQDDVVHETMTVRENLTYSAALRLKRGTRRAEREEIVRGVLGMLGMAHVQHDVVGSVGRKGLSGGQRKRLNIGLELVAKPSLLMLDEPTSGLDAAVSYDVVHALKLMAEAGMNVMVVIHQPRYSIFEMFDSVLLLGVGGRTVFLGPVSLARKYFFFLGFRPPPGENRADFYLDVISGAVQRYDKRMTDEDFIPNELFQVWEEAGRGWLIEQLLNPMGYDNDDEEMEEEEEEHYYGVAAAAAGFNDEVIVPGEPDMYGHQGYMSEGVHGGHNHHHHNHHVHSMATALPPHDYAYDPSHPDPMAHHHHHYPGHYHHHQSGYRSGPGEGDRTYHPDDYDAPDSAGRLPHYGNPGRHPYPEQYQSGDRFAETVKQAMASHRSVSSGSSAPNSPTGLSPLSPRRAGLVDGTAGSMTHQRSRFAPDRQISSNLPPPLVIAHRAGSTPGSGSTAVLSPSASTAAAAAALANATVSVTGMPPGGAAYDSVDAQGQHQLMDSTNELATALAVAPVRARRKSNLGGRAANGAAAPYGNGGGGNANGTDHPAGGEGGSRRVLNKVESLREGIAGAPGGDVPASRRFLDKVESLKEAGIDTLPAAGSPLAREVMEDGRPGGPAFGAAGRTSANRRVPRTISATSVDLGAAASAHAAAAAGSGSLGAASQGRGPAAPAALQVLPSEEGEEHIGGRGALSPAEGGELHADGGGRARQHWNRLGANIRGAVAAAGGEIQSQAADGEQTPNRGRHLWQRVNAALPTVLHQGTGTGTGTSTGMDSADSPASAAVGGHNANRRASVGHAPGKVTFGDVVAAAATAKRERLTGGPAGNAAARAALLAGPTFRRQTGTGNAVALEPNAKLSMGEMLKLAREGKERQRQQQNPKAPAGAPAGRKVQAMTSRKALAAAAAVAGESTAGPGAERPPPPHQHGAPPQGQGAMEAVDAKAELSKVKSGKLDIVKRTREAKDRDKEREGNAVQRERDGAEGEENMRRPLLGEGPQFVSRGRRSSAQPRASYEGGAAHSGSTSQFHSGALPYDPNAVEAAYGGLLLQDAGMLEDDEQHVAEMNRAYLSKWSVPWRPKDLQAIQDNFDLLASGKEDLTYGDFLAFFATTRRLLPERPYRHFVMEFSELFDLQPGMRPVDRSEFMGHVKEHLKDMSHTGHLRHRRRGQRHYPQERLEQILRAVKKYKRPKKRDAAGASSDKDRANGKLEAEAHAEAQGEFAEPASAEGWWAGVKEYFHQRNRDIVRRHRQLLAEREARRAGGHSHTHPQGHGPSHSHAGSPHVPQGTSRQALLYDTPQDSLAGDPAAAAAAAGHVQYTPPHAEAPPPVPEQYAGASPFLSVAAYQPPAVDSPRGAAGPRPNAPFANRSIAQVMQQDTGRTGSGGSFSGSQRPILAGADGVSGGGGAPAIPVGLMSLGLAHQDQGRGRQRRASGLGLPAVRPGGMPGFPISVGPGGLGEVEMSDLSQPMVLNPARERELARMLGVPVGGMGDSGYVSGMEGGGRAGSVTGGGRHGSVTRRGGRHLRPVLTPGGRASTDMFDLSVDHVASGRINKSRTGSRANSNASLGEVGAGGSGTAGGAIRHGSVSGQQLSMTNRYGSVASNNSGRGVGARIPAGRLGSIAVGGGRLPDSHAASIIAAANRVASISGGVRPGSFTSAARRMASITAHDTRVGSVVAGGTRAPDVLVIGGGRVGSMTATGRMGSITAGGGARARRRRQSYIAYGNEEPATDDGEESSMRPSFFGGGAMTGKDMLQSAFARVREKNAEQSQGPAGTGRMRRQSYVLQPEQIEPHLVDVGSGTAAAEPHAQSSHGLHSGMFQAVTSGPRGSAHISPDPSGILQYPFPFEARTAPAGSYTQHQNHPVRLHGSSAYPAHDDPYSPHSPDGGSLRPPGTSYPGGGYYPDPHTDPYNQQPYGEQSYTQPYEAGTSHAQYAGTYEGASAGGAGGGWEGSSMAAKSRGATMGGAKAGEGYEYEHAEEDDGYRISIWVLLWYYVKDAATSVWSWVWYRLQDFVAGLLGNERGGLALPSLGRQVAVVWRRSAVKFLNERIYALLDISMVIILGLILGAIQGHTSSLRKVPETSILVVLAFALTSLVTGLRTFGQEQLIFLTREAQAGLSVVSWMMGRIGWDLLLQALTPALYMGFYYAMTVFDTPFGLYYVVLFFVAWWGYGVGYLFSVLLEANNALLGGLCVTLIFGGIINGINPTVASADGNALMTGLQYLSYTRWAVEGVFIATATPTSRSMVFLTAGAMANLGFCDMDQHIKPIEGGLDPANLAEAFRPLFEQQFNTTVGGGDGGGTSQNSQTVAFLYRVYMDPSIIDSMCRTAFALDLVWLFVWGVVTRLMTFAVLCYKVERRMTTASVFG